MVVYRGTFLAGNLGREVFVFLGKVPQHMNRRRTVMTLLCSLIVGVGLPMTVQGALWGRLAATPGGTDYQAYYAVMRGNVSIL